MKTERAISLILLLVLLLSLFTSCSNDPRKLAERAEVRNGEIPYVVEIDLDYSCNDSAVKGVFEELERNEITIYVDGDDAIAKSEIMIDYDDVSSRFTETYTVFGGVVYDEMSYSISGSPKKIRNKALINTDQTKALLGEVAIIGDISLDDFSDVKTERVDGEKLIVCRDVSVDRRIALERAVLSQLESSADMVKATEVVMTVEIDGGFYDTVAVECTFEIDLYGTVYTVGMRVELEFDYDEYFVIHAPADADEYNSVEIEKIIG